MDAVREGHPLLAAEEITPELYAACGHVVASRRGNTNGPVDRALASLGLRRAILAVVPDFSAALAIAKASDMVALVTASLTDRNCEGFRPPGNRLGLPGLDGLVANAEFSPQPREVVGAHRILGTPLR